MQTLPAALVKFSLEDVRNPSRLNGEGGEGQKQSEVEEGRLVHCERSVSKKKKKPAF